MADRRHRRFGENKAQITENAQEEEKNRRIREAAGQAAVFVISPSLEAALNIGRNASDKPRRIAEAIAGMDTKAIGVKLQPLLNAVRSIAQAPTS